MTYNLTKRGVTEEYKKYSWENYLDYTLKFPEVEKKKYEDIKKIGVRWEKALVEKTLDIDLLLRGQNGCGKSVFGCVVVKDLLSRGIKAFRIHFARVQQLYFENWRVPDIVLTEDVLFLEDIGKESPGPKGFNTHEVALLENLLSFRVERKFRTIISTDLKGDMFEKKYGESITDIIRNRYFPVNFPSFNIASKKAQERTTKFLEG